MRNAAFSSCASEASLDAGLAVLLQTFEGAHKTSDASRADVVAALRAHGAQLVSLQKALFKDQQFASWQRASCAVEALRGVCASALYASADAGGSQRKRWQELYDQANRFINRFQAAGPADTGLLAIEPSEERTKRRGSDGSDDEEEDEEDEREEVEEVEPGRQHQSGPPRGLTQLLLDGLLRHSLALQPLAQHEATADADALQRTFSHAEMQLEDLADMFLSADVSAAKAKASGQRPWERARARKRVSLEVAEQAAQPALEQATKGLAKVQDSLQRVEDRLAKAARL